MATLQEMLAGLAQGQSVAIGKSGSKGRRKNATAPAVQHAHTSPKVSGGFLDMGAVSKAQGQAQAAYAPPSSPGVAGLEKREGRFGEYIVLTVVKGDGSRYKRLSTGPNSDVAAVVAFLNSLDAATLATIIGDGK